MTGGQMAPTTLVGMKATTAPEGPRPQGARLSHAHVRILNQLTAPAYLARCSCNTPQNVMKTKKAIRKAFQNQIDGKGFSMVEIVTSCPTNWGLDALSALDFLGDKMLRSSRLAYTETGGMRKVNGNEFAGSRLRRAGRYDARQILAAATCDATDKNVTFFPSYGAEQRGGTANCYVVISDNAVGTPIADEMDELIVMNQPRSIASSGS